MPVLMGRTPYLSVLVVVIGSTAALQQTSRSNQALTPATSCKSWCEEANCAWEHCLGCAICQAPDVEKAPAPAPHAACKSWCVEDNCAWEHCLGCNICQAPEVATTPAAPEVSITYHRAAGVPRGECTHKLKPSLLFIGQAYSGSTSLSEQMALHPELSVGKTKEHQYFKADFHKIKSEERYEKYLDEFWVSCNTTVAYDATMDYLNIAMGTAKTSGRESVNYIRQRMGGKVKIMAMIRDPVDLLFHKKYCNIPDGSKSLIANDLQPRPFKVEKPWNLSRQDDRATLLLETWQKVYPDKKNWLFLDSHEYFENPQKVLDKVFKFAGVKQFKLNSTQLDVQSGRRRCTKGATSAERHAFWSSKDNQEEKTNLEKITGLKFAWKRN